jgi:predicted phosphodiesterase
MVSPKQLFPLPPAGANAEILIFGDPHGDFAPVIAAVQRLRPEAIVLLGDIQARQPLHIELRPIMGITEVWFIEGNHDTDSDADYDNLWGSELADNNLHGRGVEIGGYKVAGLGGTGFDGRARAELRARFEGAIQ